MLCRRQKGMGYLPSHFLLGKWKVLPTPTPFFPRQREGLSRVSPVVYPFLLGADRVRSSQRGLSAARAAKGVREPQVHAA